MGLKGKLEVDIDIASCGDTFHELFKSTPHHVSNITPEKIHGCKHDDDYGQPGSVAHWDYTLGGKKCYAKLTTEVDEANKTVKLVYFEGDLLEEFKSFSAILEVIPKGEITTVKWIAVFEKFTDDGLYPTHVMDFWIAMTRDIEAHHLANPNVDVEK